MARLLVALLVAAIPLPPSNSTRVSPMTQDPLKPVTVCEVLQSLKALNGQLVAVLGRWRATDEGTWLDADTCTVPLKTNGFEWPACIFLRVDGSGRLEPEITLDTDAVRRALREASRQTALSQTGDRWAVVYGRLVTRELVVATAPDGTIRGYGFGHLNSAPAQLRFSQRSVKVFSEGEVKELLKTG